MKNHEAADLCMERMAIFDQERTHRYLLVRRWDRDKPTLLGILLNPSTADDESDDPTTRRMMQFAAAWGFGEWKAVNLFALRSPDPADLRRSEAPIGLSNDAIIRMEVGRLRNVDKIMCAWGNHGSFLARSEAVLKMLKGRPLWCLGTNKSGSPVFPLYQKSSARLIPFQIPTKKRP